MRLNFEMNSLKSNEIVIKNSSAMTYYH